MTNQEAKNELIKRYKFLNEYASFILSPYIYEEKDSKIKFEMDTIMYQILEEFLLGTDKLENSLLYIIIEDLKEDEEYLKRVEEGIKLLEKKNSNPSYLKESLDINNILHKIGKYIDEQSDDLENKENKLKVLDEYFRLLRYKNNGKIYTSGRHLDIHDCDSVSLSLQENKPSRGKNDIGVEKNNFIDTIVKTPKHEYNKSIFSEEEKQEVYVEIHKDLPYYLEITCELEEEYIKTMIESRLIRPDETEPCHEPFNVDKNKIFINPDDRLYRYYQLCPHCGYIVNIPKEIIPESIKAEIEERCSKSPNLFRINFLKSELKALETQTQEGLTKRLK